MGKKLAIIPARGGSKRISRKNIRDFLGKPIIVYSIEAALKSDLFDEVMVSTDDQEIAEIAKKHGAKIPFIRSKKNANDYATTVDVLLEVIGEYKNIGQVFSSACCIYPTAPLINIEKLKEGWGKIEKKLADVVFPIASFGFPVWRAVKKEENGKLSFQWPEFQNSRSQDLLDLYHDAGQWYWFKVAELEKQKTLFQENTVGLEISEEEAQDIDTPTDWKLAELKYQLKYGKS
ncbi:MAG: pseudaminic acid cytidylyltransferase [Flammeovirgaceae bacterium]|nr:pseudaminic acid cytidylyltransferase [Flammeovirgaceae bacterium]